MTAALIPKASALTFAAFAALTVGPATAQSAMEACTAFPSDVDTHVCLCPANPPGGSVWGAGPYTADSDICTAARHAGVLVPQGGPVVLLAVPGQAGYTGSLANGVASSSWGAYDRSFAFAGTPSAALFVGGAGAATATTKEPEEPVCAAFPDGELIHFCSCPAGFARGTVWGSGPYAAASDLCTSALHDGYITADGGPVVAISLTGLTFYSGSEANGVMTLDAGEYGLSVIFDRNSQ